MYSLAALDPRTKMLLVLGISTGAMAVSELPFLLGLLAAVFFIMVLGGVSVRRQAGQAKAALGMVVFLFILQAVFGQVYLGAMLSIRLLIVIMSALILLTGQARDYLLGLIQLRIPYEIAYMVIISLHFFPLLREAAMDVFYSMQLRGTELKKTSLRKKIRTYLKMCLPILAGALERAKDTSIAMEARAFRSHSGRTYMRNLQLRTRDKILMVLIPVATGLFIFLAAVSAGTVSLTGSIEPPSQIVLSQTGDPSDAQGISWYGQEAYEGTVRYGKKTPGQEQPAKAVAIREDYVRYKAVLEGLEPGTTYYYQVGDGKTWSKTRSFQTAPKGREAQESVFFLYLGDVQYQVRDQDYKKWSSLVQRAWKQNPHAGFGIFGGDMVEKSGDTQDWSAFFNAAQPVFSRIFMATVPGNHETSVIPYTYLQMLPVYQQGPVQGEVYSFDYGDCHFLMLNSCLFMEERKKDMGTEKWKKQMKAVESWIRKDLGESTAAWKIAVMHHPPYPAEEDDEIYEQIRNSWTPLLEKGETDLVLCGHQHVYMRTRPIRGITYVIGNSGSKESYYYREGLQAPAYAEKLERKSETYQLITVTEDRLSLEAFDKTGLSFDQWSRKK